MSYERLSWDSEFFGVGIGRVDLGDLGDLGDPAPAALAALAAIDDLARADGVSCLYASVDPADVAATIQLQQAGYLLVEVALDLRHPTSRLARTPDTTAVVRTGTPDDLEPLSPLLDRLAPWSRYAVDPRFGAEAARRMQAAWAARAAGPDPDRFLLVSEDDGEIVGFCTGSTFQGELPRIDLIATTRPGREVAEGLVDARFAGFPLGSSMGGPIAARNIASLRFVLGMGYGVATCRYMFHKWLDEA